MGPFPTALRQLKFLVVGIDYFTKWVEAEPPSHYHGKEHPYLCMEENYLQVWDTEGARFEQWKAIRQQRIQGLLLRAGH